MTERQLAENICKVAARNLVDDNGGVSMGGISLAEAYAQRHYKAGGYDPKDVDECAAALRHWVEAAGYDENGNFQYIITKAIQNC